MDLKMWLLVFGSLCLVQSNPLEAFYQCGIPKRLFIPLIHHGPKVQAGEWPWHVALFHKTDGGSPEYACGGTLLNQNHVLTAGHCVWNHEALSPFPASRIELHFGQQYLSKKTNHVQIRGVSKIYIHPDYSSGLNDIAVLVMRLPVQFSDYVIPICMDQRADRDLRNLEGQRGWIAGWGTTGSGNVSDVLRSASMPVVDSLKCVNHNGLLNGIVNENVFCAGDLNGTSPGTGDSGGGMFFKKGDRWVLRGIVSLANENESKTGVDTSKYVVFTNVQRFLTWINEILDESKPAAAEGTKRKSEIACEIFAILAKKRGNGDCLNSRRPHTVFVANKAADRSCTGILVTKKHVLTTCHCIREEPKDDPFKVQIDAHGEIDVIERTCHPQYKRKTIYHDLAILKLNTSIGLSSSLIPACLASNRTENLLDKLLLTGFVITELTNTRKFLESDENHLLSDEECLRRIIGPLSNAPWERAPNGYLPTHLCVANSDITRYYIDGFAGSPLQSFNSRTCMHTVVGVSTGAWHYSPNEDEIALDFYTRVAYHLDWIEKIVWNGVDPTHSSELPWLNNFPNDLEKEVLIPYDML